MRSGLLLSAVIIFVMLGSFVLGSNHCRGCSDTCVECDFDNYGECYCSSFGGSGSSGSSGGSSGGNTQVFTQNYLRCDDGTILNPLSGNNLPGSNLPDCTISSEQKIYSGRYAARDFILSASGKIIIEPSSSISLGDDKYSAGDVSRGGEGTNGRDEDGKWLCNANKGGRGGHGGIFLSLPPDNPDDPGLTYSGQKGQDGSHPSGLTSIHVQKGEEGGKGGGTLMIYARKIVLNGQIIANGEKGFSGSVDIGGGESNSHGVNIYTSVCGEDTDGKDLGPGGGGAGGGGTGGLVTLYASEIQGTGSITLKGGDGGKGNSGAYDNDNDDPDNHGGGGGSGGGGSGGYVMSNQELPETITLNLQGGLGGPTGHIVANNNNNQGGRGKAGKKGYDGSFMLRETSWKFDDEEIVDCEVNGVQGQKLSGDDNTLCCVEGSEWDNNPWHYNGNTWVGESTKYYCDNNQLINSGDKRNFGVWSYQQGLWADCTLQKADDGFTNGPYLCVSDGEKAYFIECGCDYSRQSLFQSTCGDEGAVCSCGDKVGFEDKILYCAPPKNDGDNAFWTENPKEDKACLVYDEVGGFCCYEGRFAVEEYDLEGNSLTKACWDGLLIKELYDLFRYVNTPILFEVMG